MHSYFRLRTISLDVQNREEASAQKNDTKSIGWPCFQKIVGFPWIHSIIKVQHLDKVLFAVPILNDALFSTHFFCRSHSHINKRS
jgi:hypothetical protein